MHRSERRPESRLSCQIKLSAALDGLVVRLPDAAVAPPQVEPRAAH